MNIPMTLFNRWLSAFGHPRRQRSTKSLCFGLLVFFLLSPLLVFAQHSVSQDAAVEVWVDSVDLEIPTVTLKWNWSPTIQYAIYRRDITDDLYTPWSLVTNDMQVLIKRKFTDDTSGLIMGHSYEYRIDRTRDLAQSQYKASDIRGYVAVSLKTPLIEHRGTVVLVTEDTIETDCSEDILQFKMDLIGDGWTVAQVSWPRHSTPLGCVPLKARIKEIYQQNPTEVKAVILLGHLPIPYSGLDAPDGHDPQLLPADSYYGDMLGEWTDNQTYSSGSSTPNKPNDGYFDQNYFPNETLQLMVGRIDFVNMPAFNPLTATDLLKRYLTKNHNYRVGLIKCDRKGMVRDGFSVTPADATCAGAWRTFNGMFGEDGLVLVDDGEYFTELENHSYLWAMGAGGGSTNSLGTIGTTADFKVNKPKAVFNYLFGSAVVYWPNSDDFMRACLASEGWGLTCMWGGRPHIYAGLMAVGEPVGIAVLMQGVTGGTFSQNDPLNSVDIYTSYYSAKAVHAGLLGDPTLRLHVVSPPQNAYSLYAQGTVVLEWEAPSDEPNIVGYHIYRASNLDGPYQRLTSDTPITATHYSDSALPAESGQILYYMIRAVKLEEVNGAYWNISQGIYRSQKLETTSYGDWAASYPGIFGRGADPDSDPDGDNWKNFMEYLLGGNPVKSDGTAIFQWKQTETEMVAVLKPTQLSNYSYTVEFTHNPGDWSPAGIARLEIKAGDLVDGAATLSIPAGSPVFARVIVKAIEPLSP